LTSFRVENPASQRYVKAHGTTKRDIAVWDSSSKSYIKLLLNTNTMNNTVCLNDKLLVCAKQTGSTLRF